VATVTNLHHLLLLLFLLHVQNLPPQAQSSPSAAAREKALHLSFHVNVKKLRLQILLNNKLVVQW